MQIPVQLSFRDIEPSAAAAETCRREVDKLERYADRITRCRVTISRPHHSHHKGSLFSVHVDLTLPGARIVVSREPAAHLQDDDLSIAVREAFDSARRQLEDRVRRHRRQVKTHEVPPHGRIAKLFPDDDHGFIATPDGEELYFHRNAVVEGDFDALAVGDEVRFVEHTGEKGPQASSVRLVGRHHHLGP